MGNCDVPVCFSCLTVEFIALLARHSGPSPVLVEAEEFHRVKRMIRGLRDETSTLNLFSTLKMGAMPSLLEHWNFAVESGYLERQFWFVCVCRSTR